MIIYDIMNNIMNIIKIYLQDINGILVGSGSQVTLSSGNTQSYDLSLATGDAFTIESFCVTSNAASITLRVDFQSGVVWTVRFCLFWKQMSFFVLSHNNPCLHTHPSFKCSKNVYVLFEFS